MKKLYGKGSVHPSPSLVSDPIAFLPVTILTLAAALSPEDREVLAYLIYCSSNTNSYANTRGKSTAVKITTGGNRDHPPSFGCDCFRCYTSYWARWDSSPNRQLIHEIIDALEDDLVQTRVGKEKKERRRKGSKSGVIQIQGKVEEAGQTEFPSAAEGVGEEISGEDGVLVLDGEEREEDACCEKGSMRRFLSFIGERLWNVWT